MNLRTSNNQYKRRREDILALRRQGLSYREIQNELGCSKGTISYHCGKNQSEKKRVKELAERYKDDPEAFTREFADKFGFKYVEGR